jgi:hypothetical protein
MLSFHSELSHSDSPKPMTKSKGTQQAAPIRESTSSIHSTHSLTSKAQNS